MPALLQTSSQDVAMEGGGFQRSQRQRTQEEDSDGKKKNMEAAKTQLPRHTKMLMCLIVKQLLRCAQQSRDMSSVIFDTLIFKSDSPIILRIQEQTAAYGKITKQKG